MSLQVKSKAWDSHLSVNKTSPGKEGSEIFHKFFLHNTNCLANNRAGAGAGILTSWSRVKMAPENWSWVCCCWLPGLWLWTRRCSCRMSSLFLHKHPAQNRDVIHVAYKENKVTALILYTQYHRGAIAYWISWDWTIKSTFFKAVSSEFQFSGPQNAH